MPAQNKGKRFKIQADKAFHIQESLPDIFFTKLSFLMCLESTCCDAGWWRRIGIESIKSASGAGYQQRCIVIMVRIFCEINSGFSNEILKNHPLTFLQKCFTARPNCRGQLIFPHKSLQSLQFTELPLVLMTVRGNGLASLRDQFVY